MLLSAAAVGILLNIARQGRQPEFNLDDTIRVSSDHAGWKDESD
jgi:hypothetical protein